MCNGQMSQWEEVEGCVIQSALRGEMWEIWGDGDVVTVKHQTIGVESSAVQKHLEIMPGS